VFADTNILIYHFTLEVDRHWVTDAIIKNCTYQLVTSTKALSEFANVCLRKKFVKGKSEIISHIEAIAALFEVVGFQRKAL
jgi:predicted nucleic acid-binding protein